MSFLHWNPETARLRAFTSTSKGAGTTIRIELTVSDPVSAGFIMADLAKEQADEKARAKAAAKPSPKPASARMLPAPLLALPAPRVAS